MRNLSSRWPASKLEACAEPSLVVEPWRHPCRSPSPGHVTCHASARCPESPARLGAPARRLLQLLMDRSLGRAERQDVEVSTATFEELKGKTSSEELRFFCVLCQGWWSQATHSLLRPSKVISDKAEDNNVIMLEPRAAWAASVAHNPPLDRQASWHQCLTECQRVNLLLHVKQVTLEIRT